MEVLLKVVIFYASFCYTIRPRGRKGPRDEIANGVLVDYSTIQTSYPFMARLVMDAAYRCGGAVVADRWELIILIVLDEFVTCYISTPNS